jgi:hypothetical protein
MSTRSHREQRPCHHSSHIFDADDVLDRWYNPEAEDDLNWVPCIDQPCGNRYNRPLAQSNASWAAPIDQRQLRLFTERSTPLTDPSERRSRSFRPSTPVAGSSQPAHHSPGPPALHNPSPDPLSSIEDQGDMPVMHPRLA